MLLLRGLAYAFRLLLVLIRSKVDGIATFQTNSCKTKACKSSTNVL